MVLAARRLYARALFQHQEQAREDERIEKRAWHSGLHVAKSLLHIPGRRS